MPRSFAAAVPSNWAIAVALCIALALLPWFLSLYWLRILTDTLMLAIVAQGINIMAGFVGYPAFGNVVFFGIGAYGTAIAVSAHGYPMAAGIAFGAVAAAALALTVGPLLLRLRGHYFAIATLGLNEAVSALVSNMTGVTGGSTGISLPLTKGSARDIAQEAYFCFMVLFGVGLLLTIALRSSRFGYGCRAIRANEEAAEAAGVDTLRIKIVAWTVSATITAAAGGLYARWVGFIEPSLVFDMAISVKGFVMFLIGGVGTVFGPAVGAVLMPAQPPSSSPSIIIR